MTRRAIVQKWILYCLCALVLLAVQDLILVRIRIGGVHPFLLPALAVSIVVYGLGLLLTFRKAAALYEKVDL